MFTGIVQTLGQVFSYKIENNLCRLVVSAPTKYANSLELGASIAINGVCLTVVEYIAKQESDSTHISFDVIDESLRVTNLSSINTKDYINFERSLKVGNEMGGHLVSGHVHALAKVNKINKTSTNCAITFELQHDTSKDGRKYIFEKGFITINGVSLTLGKVTDNLFTVHLIPETLQRTNIGLLNVDDQVNIEFDQQTITIVDTIERMKL